MSQDLNPTARVIRAMRSRLQISQGQMSALTGISVSSLARYEAGKRLPGPRQLLRLMILAHENHDAAEAHFASHMMIALRVPVGWELSIRR